MLKMPKLLIRLFAVSVIAGIGVNPISTDAQSVVLISSSVDNLSEQPSSAGQIGQSKDELQELTQLFQRRTPGRPPISRGPLCIVSPGVLEKSNTIWSDRPLFLWQVLDPEVKSVQVTLRNQQMQEISKSQTVATTLQHQHLQPRQALLPGQLYLWQIAGFEGSFRVMAPEQRQRIQAELETLTQQLQANQASPETIAIKQAEYFANQDLWSDALERLYSLENPSPGLKQRRQEIVTQLTNGACPSAQRNSR